LLQHRASHLSLPRRVSPAVPQRDPDCPAGAAPPVDLGNTVRVRGRLVRACASLALMAALLRPAAASADHDRIPDPAPRSTAARLPSGLGLDRGTVTVSGLSSGGFF
jgi:hypothetical protein